MIIGLPQLALTRTVLVTIGRIWQYPSDGLEQRLRARWGINYVLPLKMVIRCLRRIFERRSKDFRIIEMGVIVYHKDFIKTV